MFRSKLIFIHGRGYKLLTFILIMILVNSFFVSAGNTAYDSKLERPVEYLGADLRYVFRDLAALGEFSVVMDENVTGDVSVSFEKGIPVKDAVSIVAKANGYNCLWNPDTATVIISAAKEIKPDNYRAVKLIPLKFAWAATVAGALEAVIPRERIKPDIRNNSIEVVVNELELQNINEVVSQFEQEKRLVDTEIQFLELPETVLKQVVAKYNPGMIKMGAYVITDKQWKSFAENTALKGLTRQKFTLIDGREDHVFIGDSIPGMQEVYQDGKIKYHINYTNIGTFLNFKILVTKNNQLIVKVKERIDSFKTPLKTDLSGPKTDVREIESSICVNSEQPFLLLGTLQRNEFVQMKNSPYIFPILSGLYGDETRQGGYGAVTGIIITPRITENVLPQDVSESKNDTPQVSQAPGDAADPVPDTTALAAVPTPTPAAVGPELPTDEVKPAIEIEPDKIFSEKGQHDALFTDIKYIIKKGDTFEKIIKKFGTSLQTVIERNRLSKTGEICVGTSLIISVANERVYIVKPKETLWRIARRYGTSIEILKDLNSITDITKVQAYQKIVLPGLARRIINPKY